MVASAEAASMDEEILPALAAKGHGPSPQGGRSKRLSQPTPHRRTGRPAGAARLDECRFKAVHLLSNWAPGLSYVSQLGPG